MGNAPHDSYRPVRHIPKILTQLVPRLLDGRGDALPSICRVGFRVMEDVASRGWVHLVDSTSELETTRSTTTYHRTSYIGSSTIF
jgi:hypothetical protein